jgi:GTPase SAR1 family protein
MDRSSISAPKPPKRNVVRIKIISMGPAASGKSCLIKRYCEEKVGGNHPHDYGGKTQTCCCRRNVMISNSTHPHTTASFHHVPVRGDGDVCRCSMRRPGIRDGSLLLRAGQDLEPVSSTT